MTFAGGTGFGCSKLGLEQIWIAYARRLYLWAPLLTLYMARAEQEIARSEPYNPRMPPNTTSAAERYDRTTAFMEGRYLRHSRAWLLPRATGRTLEVASGTGQNFAYYQPGVVVTGLEHSMDLLKGSLGRAEAAAVPVRLLLGDAMGLPFPDGYFDSVVCTFALCGIPDRHQALREMRRVLKPGGSLLLADHIGSTNVLIRLLQYILEAFTIPLQGEHFTRRSLPLLEKLPVEVVQTSRTSYGVLEAIEARKL